MENSWQILIENEEPNLEIFRYHSIEMNACVFNNVFFLTTFFVFWLVGLGGI